VLSASARIPGQLKKLEKPRQRAGAHSFVIGEPRVLFRACLSAVLVSVTIVAVTAQSESQRVTFRASLDLVSVAVVVRATDGRLVPDLQATDFEVLDRGTAQPIVQFHRGEDADARLALLVDSSGSMVVGAKRERSRLATEFLIAGFRHEDDASVFSFDSRLRRLTPFTRNPNELRAAVAAVKPFGATSLYDAIVGTIRVVVGDAPRPGAVLLLTDGVDTSSVHSAGDAASAAAALDLPLYVLTVGDEQPPRALPSADPFADMAPPPLSLDDLATRTGGLATQGATISQLSTSTRTILTELRHQYLLGFAAAPAKGWHELTVRVRRGRVHARSRHGYLVS
jgi:VWFA-related protein